VPFHTGELRVVEGFGALDSVLRKRLVNFSRKLNLATAHDFYEHWRDSNYEHWRDSNYDHLSCAPWCSTARRGRRRSSRMRLLREASGLVDD
jgi:hypothetical protein